MSKLILELTCFISVFLHVNGQIICDSGRSIPISSSHSSNFNFTSASSSQYTEVNSSFVPSSLISTVTIIFNGAIIGCIVAVMRCFWGLLCRFLSASITINEGTPAFEWMLLMLSMRGSNHLRLNAARSNSIAHRSLEAEKRPIFRECSPQHISCLLPKNTVHIGRAQLPSLSLNSHIFATISDGSSENTNSSNKHGREGQKITIVCAGSLIGMEHIAHLLQRARELHSQSQREGTKLYVAISDRGSFYWRNVGTRPSRLLQSVICDEDIAQNAYNDIKDFLDAATWYADRGIPYRRGYLLHGPPGTGKSSLVMALAGALKMPVYQVSLSEPSLTDSTITLLLNAVEPNSVVLLEDVDAAFCDRTSREGSSLSFSGVLNSIDGVAASEARVMFMTTNHIENLDPALIRPGRIDAKFEMTLATQSMTARMFRHFYGCPPSQGHCAAAAPAVSAPTNFVDCDIRAMSEAFSQLVPSRKFSMASIQVYLMQYKREPSAALAQAALHFQPCPQREQ